MSTKKKDQDLVIPPAVESDTAEKAAAEKAAAEALAARQAKEGEEKEAQKKAQAAAEKKAKEEAAKAAEADQAGKVSDALVKIGRGFLKDHPAQKVVYMTSDGRGFFEGNDAENYARSLTDKNVTPVKRAE